MSAQTSEIALGKLLFYRLLDRNIFHIIINFLVVIVFAHLKSYRPNVFFGR